MAPSNADRPYGSFARPPAEPRHDDVPPRRSWRARLAGLRRHSRSGRLFAAGVLAALTIASLSASFTPSPIRLTQADVDRSIKDALASATPKPNVAIAAFENVKESVVMVKTRTRGEDVAQPRGSGFILDSGGTVITSLHVVQDAVEIAIVFFDGQETSAAIAESRADFDIAILDAIASGRKSAVLASPKSLRVGDEAIAVGSPLGQRNSISAGVISRLGSTVQPSWAGLPIGGLIQFDAVMYPENSGGPLINRRGEVVGVVIAPHAGLSGIGYAVPIDGAASVAGANPF